MQPSLRVIPGVLALMVLLPTAASAQTLTSPYRFIPERQHAGVFAAYLAPSEGRVGNGPNSGPAIGARWGIDISGPLALDVEAMYAPLTRPVVDTSFAADGSHNVVGEANQKMVIALASIRFNITGKRTWHGFQPFGLVGAGSAIDISGLNTDDELVRADVRSDFGTSFAGTLGAGFEYFATSRLAFRLDAGTVLWKVPAPTAFRQQAERADEVIPESDWERNFKVTAGFSLHF